MRKIALFIAVFLMSVANSQVTYSPVELFEEGQYFFAREDYKEALYFFKKLHETAPENANFNFKVGECYLKIAGQEQLAVPYFEEAAKHPVPKKDYKPKDYYESQAPLHAYFYLGNAYRVAGNLESALKAYYKFIDSPYFYDNYNLTVVETEMKSCERAKIIQDSPVEVVKTRLEEPVYSTYSEFNPVISHDGTKLAFIRGLKFYDALFVSTMKDGVWGKPVNISPEIGSDGDYYPTGMNTDGTMLLLVREFQENSDIYITKFDGKVWSKAEKLPGKINSVFSETFASFGSSDEVIYLVSDKVGGRGGKDIWISKLEDDESWSKPKNLGKTINSDLDEETPLVCRGNQTLFFSSRSHYNMGGYDIFYSNYKDNKWSIPVNMGYPINSTRDDLFYVVAPNCKAGYHSIVDLESGISDIFFIEVNSVLAIPEK